MTLHGCDRRIKPRTKQTKEDRKPNTKPYKVLISVARKSQFDFALVKLRKFEFPHHQTSWMQLTCVAWLLSLNYLSKFKLEGLEFS